MASSILLKTCHKCSKDEGQVICVGCQQCFCIKHLLEHRQELSQQVDELTLEHDQLQQNLITDDNDRQHSLMARVDRWESKSIQKIKQVADEIRQQLKKSLEQLKQNIEKSLHSVKDQIQNNRQVEAFTEIHLGKWKNQLQHLKKQLDNAPLIQIKYDEDEPSSTHLPLIQLETIQESRAENRIYFDTNLPRWISNETKWSTNAVTVAGGHGQGDKTDQLNGPFGLFVDEDQTLYIADFRNNRIMGWKADATTGEILAGGNGEGDRLNQLSRPTDVVVDRETDSLLICDYNNRRVMLWPRFPSSHRQPEIFIDNIDCGGLIMDDQGVLYVSSYEKHEVRRFEKNGDKEGNVVAGGNGKGDNLNQLNHPTYLFVDGQSTLYVTDKDNDRVMKWMKGAKEGIIVAGGNGWGEELSQLSCPQGVWVDECENVYVVDEQNDRVMRWEKGAKTGTVIVGGKGRGVQAIQLSQPVSLFFDRHGHLYVTDCENNRVQRFLYTR